MKLVLSSILIALLAWGCKEAAPPAQAPDPTPLPNPAKVAEKVQAAAPPAPTKKTLKKATALKPATKVAKRTPAKSLTTGHSNKKAVDWSGPTKWVDWEAAQTQAKAEKKPICLVVYADWCPRCRELAPAFADEKITALADKMVMVHQNADARPSWLDDLKPFGTYVPRIFFFNEDGSLREEITSKHPRYPYFYTPKSVDALAASMKSAIDG